MLDPETRATRERPYLQLDRSYQALCDSEIGGVDGYIVVFKPL